MSRFSPATRFYLILAFCTVAVLVIFQLTGTSKRFALPILIVLITNLTPTRFSSV